MNTFSVDYKRGERDGPRLQGKEAAPPTGAEAETDSSLGSQQTRETL